MSEDLSYYLDDGWSLSEERPGYVVKKTVNLREDGSVRSYITTYRPILTEEERAKRMKLIHDAAADLLRATYEAKARKEREKHNGKNERTA